MSALAVTSGARGFTVDKFWNHVNSVLLPELAEKDGNRDLLDCRQEDEVAGVYSISHAYKSGDMDMVELHDDFDDTEGRAWNKRTVSVRFEDPNLRRQRSQRVVERNIIRNTTSTCKFGNSGDVGTCKCHLRIYRLGHDQAIFKARTLLRGVWVTLPQNEPPICG